MKLIKEHINEKFTEDSDPIKDLGIGFTFEPGTIIERIREFNCIINEQLYRQIQFLSDAIIEKTPLTKGMIIKSKIIDDEIFLELVMFAYRPQLKTLKDRFDQDPIETYSYIRRIYVVLYGTAPLETWLKFIKMVPHNNIFEKFVEDGDPIKSMNIGIGNIMPKIYKSILENDYNKFFFTIKYSPHFEPQYYNFNKPPENNKEYIQIHLNQPHLNKFPEYCKNDVIKSYIEEILQKTGIEDIFTEIKILGKFKYYQPDIDEDTFLLSGAPAIYCTLIPDIKIKDKNISAQRDFKDLDKINIFSK